MGELLRERTCGEGSPGRWGSRGPQGRESDHRTLVTVAWTSVCASGPEFKGADTCLALRRVAGRGPEVWEVSRREKTRRAAAFGLGAPRGTKRTDSRREKNFEAGEASGTGQVLRRA